MLCIVLQDGSSGGNWGKGIGISDLLLLAIICQSVIISKLFTNLKP